VICFYVPPFNARFYDTKLTAVISFFVTFGVSHHINMMLNKHWIAIKTFKMMANRCKSLMMLMNHTTHTLIQESELTLALRKQVNTMIALMILILKENMRHRRKGGRLFRLSDLATFSSGFKCYDQAAQTLHACIHDELPEPSNSLHHKPLFTAWSQNFGCTSIAYRMNMTGMDNKSFETIYSTLLHRLDAMECLSRIDANEGISHDVWSQMIHQLRGIWDSYTELQIHERYQVPGAISTFYYGAINVYYILFIPQLVHQYDLWGIGFTVIIILLFTGGFALAEQISNPYVSIKAHPFFLKQNETVSVICRETVISITRAVSPHQQWPPDRRPLRSSRLARPYQRGDVGCAASRTLN